MAFFTTVEPGMRGVLEQDVAGPLDGVILVCSGVAAAAALYVKYLFPVVAGAA